MRLLVDKGVPEPAALKQFVELAKGDPSPKVRLNLASALNRLPLAERWALADGLAGHREDAADRVLPLLIWYGVEPLVPADLKRAAGWAAQCAIPTCARMSLAERWRQTHPTAWRPWWRRSRPPTGQPALTS